MTWLKDILAFLLSPYLHLWWLLVGGYLACWGLAWALATAGGPGTIVQKCRRAWGLAFVLHLVAVIGLTVFWWQRFGFFKSFYLFLPFYIVLALADLILMLKLFAPSRV